MTDFIPVFAVLLVFGQRDFQAYLDFKTSIKKGVDLISNNSIWSVDYLVISSNQQNDNQIIVRNDLLWIEKGNKQNENNYSLLNRLISDFETLAKNRQLRNFLKHKSTAFNLYSSDLNDEELLKTEEKNYNS